MSKLDKKMSDAASRASRALIVAGDKAGGTVGFHVANALSIAVFNRDWRPCDENCQDTDHPS